MLIKLLRYLLGYVNFTARGDFPERLLNQLGFKGVSVWNMRRDGDCITASVKASDYKKMLSLRGKNRVFTRVTERVGLPFVLKKYRLRVGFAIGIVLYFSLLFGLSNFVWNIEVVGAERLQEKEILTACKELGIAEGVPIASIDQQSTPSKLALKLDGIAWCSVNIEGVKVTVNISESTVTDRYDSTPCNLVAARDGIITKIEVTNGSTAVKLGQTVKKGDLLVSGFTEYKDGSSSFGVSKGKIIAKTERTLSVTAPFTVEKTVITGKSVEKNVLSFFGIHIPFYLGSFKGEHSAETEIKRFDKNGMYLPITITKAVFTPTESITVTLSVEEATQNAEKMLKELEETELKDAETVSKNVTVEVTDDSVTLKAEYICRENIAEQDLLLIY